MESSELNNYEEYFVSEKSDNIIKNNKNLLTLILNKLLCDDFEEKYDRIIKILEMLFLCDYSNYNVKCNLIKVNECFFNYKNKIYEITFEYQDPSNWNTIYNDCTGLGISAERISMLSKEKQNKYFKKSAMYCKIERKYKKFLKLCIDSNIYSEYSVYNYIILDKFDKKLFINGLKSLLNSYDNNLFMAYYDLEKKHLNNIMTHDMFYNKIYNLIKANNITDIDFIEYFCKNHLNKNETRNIICKLGDELSNNFMRLHYY